MIWYQKTQLPYWVYHLLVNTVTLSEPEFHTVSVIDNGIITWYIHIIIDNIAEYLLWVKDIANPIGQIISNAHKNNMKWTLLSQYTNENIEAQKPGRWHAQ